MQRLTKNEMQKLWNNSQVVVEQDSFKSQRKGGIRVLRAKTESEIASEYEEYVRNNKHASNLNKEQMQELSRMNPSERKRIYDLTFENSQKQERETKKRVAQEEDEIRKTQLEKDKTFAENMKLAKEKKRQERENESERVKNLEREIDKRGLEEKANERINAANLENYTNDVKKYIDRYFKKDYSLEVREIAKSLLTRESIGDRDRSNDSVKNTAGEVMKQAKSIYSKEFNEQLNQETPVSTQETPITPKKKKKKLQTNNEEEEYNHNTKSAKKNKELQVKNDRKKKNEEQYADNEEEEEYNENSEGSGKKKGSKKIVQKKTTKQRILDILNSLSH